MVDRHTSAPIELPDIELPFVRADLVFYGLDHSGSSYEGRVFLNAPDADHGTAREDPAWAGSFYLFGHGGCFGDVGHCDIPTGLRDPYDLRPPHRLEPAIRILTNPERLQAILGQKARKLTVTVVAHTPVDRPNDILAYDTMRLITYA
jgi:tyrosinase